LLQAEFAVFANRNPRHSPQIYAEGRDHPRADTEKEPNMAQKTILRSDELSCPSCVPKIEKALNALPGVEKAEVRFNSGKIEVQHDPAQSSVDALVAAIRDTGYEARPAAF